jgi:iron complex transport system permease protein
MALAAISLLSCRRGYQALTLGEDTAVSLGVDLRQLRGLTVLGVAMGVGAGVAVSGCRPAFGAAYSRR